jgi:putative DNA primase/helicase
MDDWCKNTSCGSKEFLGNREHAAPLIGVCITINIKCEGAFMHQTPSQMWDAIVTDAKSASVTDGTSEQEVEPLLQTTTSVVAAASAILQFSEEEVAALIPSITNTLKFIPPAAVRGDEVQQIIGNVHGAIRGHYVGSALVMKWAQGQLGSDDEIQSLWDAAIPEGGIEDLAATAAKYGKQAASQIETTESIAPVTGDADVVCSSEVGGDSERIPAHVQVYVEELTKAADLTDLAAPIDRSLEIVTRLASATSSERLRQMRSSAKVLGIAVEELEKKVDAAIALHGSADVMSYGQIEPWAEPIEPAAVLDEIADTIRRYVVLSPEQAWAGALWIVMTWVIDYIEISPIGLIDAPERECGKSKLLEIFGLLVARPLQAANTTASFIFRAIAAWQVTLVIDEADTFLRENDELKGIINAGHSRANAFVGRSVAKDGDFEPKLFSVWGAKALAGIRMDKHLPESTISRCVVFHLRRKAKGEVVSKLRHADRQAFKPLIAKLARFAEDFGYQVQAARPVLPDQLSDRAADNWTALFGIASCAGPEWLARAEQAALAMSVKTEGTDSIGPELLTDVQAIFEMKRVFKLRSAELLAELISNAEMGWSAYNRGSHPLTVRQLAKLLSGYGIKTKTVRLGPTKTYKGYYRDDFEDAFARYLSSENDPNLRHIAPDALPALGVAVSDGNSGIRNLADDPNLGAKTDADAAIDAFEADLAGTPKPLQTLTSSGVSHVSGNGGDADGDF